MLRRVPPKLHPLGFRGFGFRVSGLGFRTLHHNVTR